jgi:hypothetical protein
MLQELAPYELSLEVCQAVIDVALASDVLLFGELHGTQEVPRLLLSLLSALTTAGYRGLALEIPRSDRETLEGWARAQEAVLPEFFAHPSDDGRGNREVLALVDLALTSQNDWHLLCFDQSPDQVVMQWASRDRWMAQNLAEQMRWADRDDLMAQNLTEQWQHLCPTAKIVGICGSLHSRLSRQDVTTPYWPSFAHQLQLLHPDKTICTIKIRFQTGAYFNMKLRHLHRFGWDWFHPLRKTTLRSSRDHSLELLLPRATPATFLTAPRQ